MQSAVLRKYGVLWLPLWGLLLGAATSRPSHEKAKGCIYGQLLDAQGRGVYRALVSTHPASSAKFTDAGGKFAICYRRWAWGGQVWRKALARGPYVLRVQKLGYALAPRAGRFRFFGKDLRLKPMVLQALKRPLCTHSPRSSGLWRSCWANGATQSLRRLLGGKLHGAFGYWHRHGAPYERGAYRRGKLHGRYTRFDGRGQKLYEAWYADGKQTRLKRYRAAPKPSSRPTSRPRRLPRTVAQLKPHERRRLFALMQTPLDPKNMPWSAQIYVRGASQHHIRRLRLRRPLRLRIVAFGEAKGPQMTDGAWLQQQPTGAVVWRMGLANTTAAGPDPRNRKYDGVLTLKAGRYVLHYVTDATHHPAQWVTRPAPHPRRYGIVLYNLDSRGYGVLKAP